MQGNCTRRRPYSLNAIVASVILGLILTVAPRSVFAGIDDILQAVRESEFRFARVTSKVPFIPLGWGVYQNYPGTEFKNDTGSLPSAEVEENTISIGGILPAYVSKRNMFLLGGDIAWDYINVQSGPYSDQHIVRLTPVAAWMNQLDEDETVGAFAAPILSKDLAADQPVAVNGFAGVIGMHWSSDTLQWVYGGVYQYNFGESALYPYLGAQWLPTPRLSLSLLIPWPTIAYSPADRWLLQLGIAPGGSTWVKRGDGFESTQSFGSWNLYAGTAYQLQGPYWLFAGVGVTGNRGLTSTWGGVENRFEAQSSPVYILAIQLRP
jgi:hypothetical protein